MWFLQVKFLTVVSVDYFVVHIVVVAFVVLVAISAMIVATAMVATRVE